MLGKAGIETGEKEMRATQDKNGENFNESGVVSVTAAKSPSRRTKEASNGQSVWEVTRDFCQYSSGKEKLPAEVTEGWK